LRTLTDKGFERWLMLVFALWLLLAAGQTALPLPPVAVSAQAQRCAVQVFYGDEGVDEGDCTDMGDGLCKTREYALAQGKAICPDEVQMMSGGLLRDIYRSPAVIRRKPLDTLLAALYWIVPFVAGGLAGWLIARRSRSKQKAAPVMDQADERSDA
jgi:hypothetical protein